MRTLQVMGVEDDSLVLVSDSGERFRIPIDDTLRSALRGPKRSPGGPQRVSPKDIQAHIRRGLSAQEVADLTGETVDYILPFEGPVIAEREYISQQAQAIHFQHASDRDGETTFGDWVRSRLDHLGASDAVWTAWKEESGWQVEVRFTDGEVEHRATWSFEPRKQLLVPLNDDATVLSQAEPIQGPLIPRLRPVVATDDSPAGERFDSEIFDDMPLSDTGPLTEPVAYGKTSQTTTPPDSASASNETADLLEALRRRRGEREPAPDGDDMSKANHPSTGSIRLVSADDDTEDDTADHRASVHPFPGTGEVPRTTDEPGADSEAPAEKPSSKKGRPEMPSWDDIVFGTKPDDDPA